jgi:hypothetical protein
MILIQPPVVQNWNSLVNKPSILSDNQISWDEIQNKPTTLTGYGITNALALTGGTLTGALIATSFSGVGTALTALNASNISTGTINAARLPASYSELTVSSIYPAIWLNESKAPTNKKSWYLVVDGEVLQFQTRDDNGNYLGGPLSVSRAGTTTTTDMIVSAATPSTSPTTGASRVTGGQGVQGNQYVGGFSSLGGDANHPGIKMKVLEGTAPASAGGFSSIAHGLTLSKILAVNGVCRHDSGMVTNGFIVVSGFAFDFSITPSNINIFSYSTGSENILSKPVIVTIIYTA